MASSDPCLDRVVTREHDVEIALGQIGGLLGLHVGTVARGRRELLPAAVSGKGFHTR